MINAYKIELLVVDHEGIGEAEIRAQLERSPINPRVVEVESQRVDWNENHWLNRADWRQGYFWLFTPAKA